MKRWDDLSFEMNGIHSVKVPSVETYNAAFYGLRDAQESAADLRRLAERPSVTNVSREAIDKAFWDDSGEGLTTDQRLDRVFALQLRTEMNRQMIETMFLRFSAHLHRLAKDENGLDVGVVRVLFDQNGKPTHGPFWLDQNQTDKIVLDFLNTQIPTPAPGKAADEGGQEVEIVCNGEVHYRRPINHPMVMEALRTPGYSVRHPRTSEASK